jgi:hypothetical protein
VRLTLQRADFAAKLAAGVITDEDHDASEQLVCLQLRRLGWPKR